MRRLVSTGCMSSGSRSAGALVAGRELLDDLRRAMALNPEAAHGAVLRLVKLLTPPTEPDAALARGGLAPWQKRKIDRYLNEHLTRPLRIEELVRTGAAQRQPFSAAPSRKASGRPPHMRIVRLRLELARRLMLATEEPLSQIAFACGFADQAHLRRSSGARWARPPSAWRRRNLTDAQAEARRRSSDPEDLSGAAS